LVNPCLALMVPRRVTKYVAPCLSEPAKWRLAARMAFGGGEVRPAPVALTSHYAREAGACRRMKKPRQPRGGASQ